VTLDASGHYSVPAASSPLVGALSNCFGFDQLGVSRPLDCTAGAIEFTGDPMDPDPVDPDPEPTPLLECGEGVDPAFDDVTAGSTHADAIACAAEAGMVSGYADGTFKPGRAISRAQFASVLFETLNVAGADLVGVDPDFDDVTVGSTHADAIGALADAAVIVGMGDGTFAPEQPISRAQVSSMILRAAVLLERPFAPAAPNFSDVGLDDTHADGIGALAGADVVSGFADGTFGPQLDVTHGQSASMLVRWL